MISCRDFLIREELRLNKRELKDTGEKKGRWLTHAELIAVEHPPHQFSRRLELAFHETMWVPV